MWGSEQFPPLGKCLQLAYQPVSLRYETGLYPVSLTALCPVMVPTLNILFYFLLFNLCILITEDLLVRLFPSTVVPR